MKTNNKKLRIPNYTGKTIYYINNIVYCFQGKSKLKNDKIYTQDFKAMRELPLAFFETKEEAMEYLDWYTNTAEQKPYNYKVNKCKDEYRSTWYDKSTDTTTIDIMLINEEPIRTYKGA